MRLVYSAVPFLIAALRLSVMFFSTGAMVVSFARFVGAGNAGPRRPQGTARAWFAMAAKYRAVLSCMMLVGE